MLRESGQPSPRFSDVVVRRSSVVRDAASEPCVGASAYAVKSYELREAERPRVVWESNYIF